MKNDLDVMRLIDETAVPFVPTESDMTESQGQSKQSSVTIPEFQPFPTDTLPALLAEFVRQASQSIQCDESMIVTPLRAAVAGAIGNTRQVEIKHGRYEPSILWAVIIAQSGERKSPAFRQVENFFQKVVIRSRETYQDEMTRFKKRQAEYKRDLDLWKRSKGDYPEEPIEPTESRYIIGDTTAEAAAHLLSQNSRGLILMRDELAGFFNSFGQYKSGNADSPFWLQCYDGGFYSVDRRGRKDASYVQRCSVSIAGTIQPETMRRFLYDREAVENGLLQRFVLSSPPERQTRWSDNVIDEDVLRAVQSMFDNLLSLDFRIDSNENEHPETVRLSDDARRQFIEVENQYGLEKLNCHPDLKGFWSKTPGRIARLALQHHLTRFAFGESVCHDTIDADSMLAAVKMGRWDANETSRVYAMLGCGSEGDDVRERREILDTIKELGGTASVSEINQSGSSKNRNESGRQALEKILRKLAFEGFVKSETVNSKGRPKEVFSLV